MTATTSINDLIEFALEHGEDCFRRWTLAEMRRWFAHHDARGTLLHVTNSENQIVGLGVGWPVRREDLREDYRDMDYWPAHPVAGADAFYFAQLIATHPAALTALVAGWARRFPESVDQPLYAHRLRRGWHGRRKFPELKLLHLRLLRRLPYFARCWRDGALNLLALAE